MKCSHACYIWRPYVQLSTPLFRVCSHIFLDILGIEHLSLMYCNCQPLPLTLLGLRLFLGSPVHPTFAFNINHLLWASTFFLNGIPNISTWTAALMAYLGQKAYEVPSTV
jgi:hypothetical protein